MPTRALSVNALMFLAVPLAVFFTGCADIEAMRLAREASTALPGERTVSAKEVGLDARSLLTLERGLQIARSYNPAILIAQRRVEEAEAQLQQAWAGYLPQVTVSDALQNSNSLTASSATNTHQGNLAANQLLFDFGSVSAQIRQAAKTYLATQLDLQAAEVDITFQLRQAFFTTLEQQALVYVGEETVRQFEIHLEQVKQFLEVGRLTKYDFTKAQVDLGNAQLNLVKARTSLAVSHATLNNVLGLAEDARYLLEKPKPMEGGERSFDAWGDIARKNQPRLLAQEAREQAAQAAVDSSVANLFPTLSLEGIYSWSGNTSPLIWSWVVGPVANWVLYSGGKNTALVKQAVAAFREARTTRAQVEQQIFLELQQAWTQLVNARERFKIANLTVKQAEENLTLVQGRYRIGRASAVDLTDAQTALASARSEQVQAEYDIEISLAQLKRESGLSEKGGK